MSVDATIADQPLGSSHHRHPWWAHPFRMFQTNLREIDAGLDVEQTLDYIETYGANAWLVNAGGITSFYPTDLGFQTRTPHLAERPSGDLIGDALAAAHARGVRLLARMDFSKVPEPIAAEHPDWAFVSSAGERQVFNGLTSMCPSGPYYQERAFEVLDEFCTRYPVDGFFFNWLLFNDIDYHGVYHGACRCSSCRAAFDAFAPGVSFPESTEGDDYTVWRAFVIETLRALAARFQDSIAAHLPDAAFLNGADIAFHEASAGFGGNFWPHATAQAVSVSKSRRPGVPALVNAAVFVTMPYRLAPINDDQYASYLIQAMARGGLLSTYTIGVPLSTPYANLEVGGELTRHHREHQDVYRGLRPASATLLVTSGRRSRWWVSEPDDEFRGAYEALLRAHVPFDVAEAGDLECLLRDDVARWAVVVLCDVGPIGPTTAEVVDDWVCAGGRIVLTGSSALDGERVECATSPGLRRSGSEDDATRLFNTFVAAPSPGVGDGFDRRSAVAGGYHYLEYAADAELRLTLLAQAPYAPPEKAYGTMPTPHPGIALRRAGEGIHAVVPWSIGRTARLLGTESTGRMLASLVDELEGDQRVLRADLPEQVELIVTENDRGLVVHVLNHTGIRGNSVGAPVLIVGGALRVPGVRPAVVRALVADAELAARDEPDGTVIALPEVGRFEVIEIVCR